MAGNEYSHWKDKLRVRSVGWTNAPVLVTLLSEAVLVTLLGEASEMEIRQSLFRELRVNFVWSKDLNSNS
jgi:hypothetical protein